MRLLKRIKKCQSTSAKCRLTQENVCACLTLCVVTMLLTRILVCLVLSGIVVRLQIVLLDDTVLSFEILVNF